MPRKRSHPQLPAQRIAAAAGYASLLQDLKSRIRAAQVRAALSVNRELIELYWSIGRDIVLRQEAEGWGKSIVDHLAADLQHEFPGMAGFSRANIYRMRSFYLAYRTDDPIVSQAARQPGPVIVSQPARQLSGVANLAQVVRQSPPTNLTQAVSDSPANDLGPILPQAAAEIPWFHNVVLIEKIKDPARRLWYARQTTLNGWSRSMLEHWIESDLYSRQGNAVTNFKSTLPAPQSDLANQLIKDPYTFDFLTLAADAAERELELGLLGHIRQFLLELGAGFAFVGQQVPLQVDGEDFYLDLLFYHLHLRCFIVVDLKTGRFEPEFAGKMNFYLSAVDDRMRKAGDAPSIGLILCKKRSKVIAEYALRHLHRPVGVSRYVTRLTEKLPRELARQLPSAKQIEAELSTNNKTSRTRRKGKRGGKA